MQYSDNCSWRAGFFQYIDGGLDFSHFRHAGRQNDGLAHAAYVTQVGQVGDLPRGNLEAILAKARQQVNTLNVKAG